MADTETSPPWRAYSCETVAAILDVPIKQVYGLVHSGALPSFRVGKHIRIPDSALRAFAGQDPTPRGGGVISDEDRDAIRRAGDAQQADIESWRPLDSTERDLIRRAFGVDPDQDTHRAS